ncbi:MAG: hypothetical protein ACKVQB_07720 [Bacteroidia bacterium]
MEKRLLIFATIEILLLTVFHNLFGSWVQPVVWLVVAILPAIWLLQGKYYIPEFEKNQDKIKVWIFIATIACGIILTVYFSQKYILDAKYSDIIPTIQLFIKRFLNGQPVYTLIQDFGYDLAPTYLPGHWFPFIPSEILHIDPRVWAFILGMLAWLPLVLSATPLGSNIKISSFLPFGLFVLWLISAASEIGYNIEWLMAGYYVLFAWALVNKNPWWIAFSLTLILLSRFSLVLWLPLVLPLFFIKEWRKIMISVSITTAVVILFIYVIPFLSQDWNALKNAQDYYSVAALKEWSGQYWQKSGDDAFQLARGYGFAYWYYKLGTGSLPQKIAIFKNIQLIICLGFTFLIGMWYYLKTKEKLDVRLFMLGSLKIYLTLFYGLIQVPYPYLFMVPAGFTLALLFIVRPKVS